MPQTRQCPQCGAELPPDVPEGVCPKCVLGLGLADRATESGPRHGPFKAPTPQELAKHFPQLEIIELVGQGGMGAVYKARQPGLDRLVAVKILPPHAATDPAFAERFAREARALAKLNHPNIVAVYDFGNHEGLFYFMMEYVEGVNLRQLIRSGECTPEQALRIVPQICEALQFAHDEGIMHRDIKPENILLDKRGRLKIADFGLAKLLRGVGQPIQADSSGIGSPVSLERLTYTGQVMGTPNYMAPEQLDDPLKVDHRADIYALGVVFYELLTGELPRGRFAPPSQKVQVDVRLDEVVLRTLEQAPERRYQHASEVKTDVETISRSQQPANVSPPQSARGVSLKRDVTATLLLESGRAHGTQSPPQQILAIAATAAVALAFSLAATNGVFDLAQHPSPVSGMSLPVAILAMLAVAALLVIDQLHQPGGSRAALPEVLLATLGACCGSLPWMGEPLPFVGWQFWHGAVFSGLNFALCLLLLTMMSESHTRKRGAALILTGLAGFALVNWFNIGPVGVIGDDSIFKTITRKPNGPGMVLAAAQGLLSMIAGALRLRAVGGLSALESARAQTSKAELHGHQHSSANVAHRDFAKSAELTTEDPASPFANSVRRNPPGDQLIATGRDVVQAPADAILLAGVASLLAAFAVVLWSFWTKWDTGSPVYEWANIVGFAAVDAVCALFMLAGGAFMRRLRFRNFVSLSVAVAGLFVPALLGIHVILKAGLIAHWKVLIPMWLGMPVAVWATIVLFRRDVRAAFDQGSEAPAAAPRQNRHWWLLPRTVTLLAALGGGGLTAAPWQRVDIREPFSQGAIIYQWFLSPGYEFVLGLAVAGLFAIAFVVTITRFNLRRAATPTVAIIAGLMIGSIMAVYGYNPPLADRPEVAEMLAKLHALKPELQVEGRSHIDVVREAAQFGLIDYWQRIIPGFYVTLVMAVLIVIAGTLDFVLVRQAPAVETEKRESFARVPRNTRVWSPARVALMLVAIAAVAGLLVLLFFLEGSFSQGGRDAPAQMSFTVAGPHVHVSLNGQKLMVANDGTVNIGLRPGDYETAYLKRNLLQKRKYEFVYAGQQSHHTERDVDTIWIKGPLTLEFAPASGKPTVADFTALQGRWTIVAQVRDGAFLLEQHRGKWIEFDKDIMRGDIPEKPLDKPFFAETRFAIDSAATPRQFDELTLGAKGIYRLDGDILTFAIANAGQPRPTEFVSRPGSLVRLTICRREAAPKSK